MKQIFLFNLAALHACKFTAQNGKYAIVTNRWQTFTDVFLNESIDFFAEYADELLIHGVDVEGKRLCSLNFTKFLWHGII